MMSLPTTGLARTLAAAPVSDDPKSLAAAWADQDMMLCLSGAARLPHTIGSHLRRSFLGALGRGASVAAMAGDPCPWDPPCALDVFCREQLRGPKGDGLPKPYAMALWPEGRDLIVSLRVFGMANDWAMAAFEAMVVGIREILPWSKVAPHLGEVPAIADRRIAFTRLEPSPAPRSLRMVFVTPVDATGTDALEHPATLLARALRRADAVSRWNGAALDPEVGRALAAHLGTLEYDTADLKPGWQHAPNRQRQARTDPTLLGSLHIRGDIGPIWPLLQITERAHIGRHAVQGLGRIKLVARP